MKQSTATTHAAAAPEIFAFFTCPFLPVRCIWRHLSWGSYFRFSFIFHSSTLATKQRHFRFVRTARADLIWNEISIRLLQVGKMLMTKPGGKNLLVFGKKVSVAKLTAYFNMFSRWRYLRLVRTSRTDLISDQIETVCTVESWKDANKGAYRVGF